MPDESRIVVERAGLMTTVQDTGRPGHQHEGVPAGGAMDDLALRLANLLVGNAAGDAALECTLEGPALRFAHRTRVAVTGADMAWHIDDRPLPSWRSAVVPAGSLLSAGTAHVGCRAYVAVAGGVLVPPLLGSRATLPTVGIGGLEGRALRKGDVLDIIASERGRGWVRRGVSRDVLPAYGGAIRVVPGPDLDALDAPSRARLTGRPFRVSPRSDRMGVRLDVEGTPLSLRAPLEPLSAGVAMGTVQLPPGGAPIVLMADRQTTGGYPRLAEVATVDLPLVAQLRPGDEVRFTMIPLADAQALYVARERELRRLAMLLAWPA